jgi:hypothetical protein
VEDMSINKKGSESKLTIRSGSSGYSFRASSRAALGGSLGTDISAWKVI